MNKKMILSGPASYYFSICGTKNNPLFNSVFEYDYFCQLLANTENCELIAYVFSEHQAQWVMRCGRDANDVLDDIRAQMQELHFQLWHKHHPVISEDAKILLIDEDQFLTPLVMHLHRWPVKQKMVASPEVYAWSSDHHYRQATPPKWLHAQHMLKRLALQRNNAAARYQRVMQQPQDFDLAQAEHSSYQALASDKHISQHLERCHIQQHPAARIDYPQLRQQAEELVCDCLGISIEHAKNPRYRRQYHQVEPLSVWLLIQSGHAISDLVRVFDLDETIANSWMRSITATHPKTLLDKLEQRWFISSTPPTEVLAEAI